MTGPAAAQHQPIGRLEPAAASAAGLRAAAGPPGSGPAGSRAAAGPRSASTPRASPAPPRPSPPPRQHPGARGAPHATPVASGVPSAPRSREGSPLSSAGSPPPPDAPWRALPAPCGGLLRPPRPPPALPCPGGPLRGPSRCPQHPKGPVGAPRAFSAPEQALAAPAAPQPQGCWPRVCPEVILPGRAGSALCSWLAAVAASLRKARWESPGSSTALVSCPRTRAASADPAGLPGPAGRSVAVRAGAVFQVLLGISWVLSIAIVTAYVCDCSVVLSLPGDSQATVTDWEKSHTST